MEHFAQISQAENTESQKKEDESQSQSHPLVYSPVQFTQTDYFVLRFIWNLTEEGKLGLECGHDEEAAVDPNFCLDERSERIFRDRASVTIGRTSEREVHQILESLDSKPFHIESKLHLLVAYREKESTLDRSIAAPFKLRGTTRKAPCCSVLELLPFLPWEGCERRRRERDA
ncbi:hypothetical protein EYF80_026386 [Liparis tanakae]|uniref:Uncharacterized protein n=1 Tax=Liparis tanakae TaxID=230148 RepID=A0A4Z2HD49_9TELE|nr:hypothetical protein EYF80_026386 [Liparis tanakae]